MVFGFAFWFCEMRVTKFRRRQTETLPSLPYPGTPIYGFLRPLWLPQGLSIEYFTALRFNWSVCIIVQYGTAYILSPRRRAAAHVLRGWRDVSRCTKSVRVACTLETCPRFRGPRVCAYGVYFTAYFRPWGLCGFFVISK